ncbi:MAG: SAM-dependent methyltransferase [Oscillospiraceae bacterium]|nr:SAM-dependent methyltransferase [Oscillospiraceae bacterium]
MRIPICERLLCCAEQVRKGSRVADIGCDHGYLGIWLIKNGIADYVIASDLREQPLQKAIENSRLFGTDDRMEFHVADGLTAVSPERVDTVICAGMGGDCIAHILEEAPWVKDPKYTLILQPQTSGNDLRRYLGEQGYSIEAEHLVQDGGFLYFTIKARYGEGRPLSPGEQYLSKQLLSCGSELLPAYFDRVINALTKTVEGIRRSKKEHEKLSYYETALHELLEMRDGYDRTEHP